jgi:D-alanyl-D-alanine carboxypeptidase
MQKKPTMIHKLSARFQTITLAISLLLSPGAAERVAAAPVGAAAVPLGPPLQRTLDRLVADNDGFGGGVFRLASGEEGILWEGTSGDLTHDGAAMQADAVFQIASTSKAFTAVTALLLIQDGLFSLDDTTGDLLPPEVTSGLLVIDGHDYGPELTVRQLLAHTSGLPDYWYDPPFILPGFNAFLIDYTLAPNRFWEPEEILAYIPGLDPIFVPGTGRHYSDTGYLLAGLIIEEISGRPLHEVYQERLFTPLGLDDTWLQWRQDRPGDTAESHRYEGTWDMYDKRHQTADWAGGGLVSSTRDLERFARALADGTLIHDPTLRAEMLHRTPTGQPAVDYGLGLFLVGLGNGQGEIIGHDGYGNSWMYYWPKQDVTMVGTLNQTENDWWPLVKIAATLIEWNQGG